jgi:PadR family transcriptional regulator, regulatory protein AphA
VEKELVERAERLDLKIYTITGAGRTALHQWLSTPLPEQDDREPFLIQIYFGGKLSDGELLALLQYRLKVTEERLAVYEAVYQASQNSPGSVNDPRAIFLSFLTLEAGYNINKSQAEWLRTAIERIGTPNYLKSQPELIERLKKIFADD